MLESINCEPYGYTKYKNDDLDSIIIKEVEDIESKEVETQNQEQKLIVICIMNILRFKILKLQMLK